MKNTNTVYMVKIPEAMTMFSRGRNRICDDARAAGAFVRCGRSRLIIVSKLMKYYEDLAK